MASLYHLGCGDTHLDGYINVDVRPTDAADLVTDLNELVLPGGHQAAGFFSHAFFEHLRRDARVPHLAAAHQALTTDGFVCYLGLPDFARIARLYLDRAPGIVGPVFDLYNVYRYTHGDPEREEGYFEQLHKSLFDVEEVERLLREAGFASYVSFSYVFPEEPAVVSLGFFAVPEPRPVAQLEVECRAFLAQFDGRFVEAETIEFHGGQTRSVVRTRVGASAPRRAISTVAHKVAIRLARL